jgi:hypothetical protein
MPGAGSIIVSLDVLCSGPVPNKDGKDLPFSPGNHTFRPSRTVVFAVYSSCTTTGSYRPAQDPTAARMNNHMYILLVAEAQAPHNTDARSPRFYKISKNKLYTTHEAENERNWERPVKTLTEETGQWLTLEAFSTPSCTITKQSDRQWTMKPRSGGASVTLKKPWKWRTPKFESGLLDATKGVGAELAREWADGKICYLPEHGTLFHEEKQQQFGFTNFRRIVKLDRGSNAWSIYDNVVDAFRPVTNLIENEHFAKLKVEDLQRAMFKPASSIAWQNFMWFSQKVGEQSLNIGGALLVGSILGNVGRKVRR